ncbi:PadR family transcriptional regulator [Actinokineospora sp.]|uniref:PadR family transcriptional regulator n=1 Tax=Actinokineospora sp. TaxID=1872133 RepID=UPI0040383011
MRTSHEHRRHARRHHHHHAHRHFADLGLDFDPEDEMTPPFPPMPPFAPGPPFGFGGRGRGRGPGRGHGPGRQRRGDVRAALLSLLVERPMHGYEMIQEIAARSGGFWKPSPGSVYPTLQLLADEGLVRGVDGDGGKRLFELTEDGAAAVDKLDGAPPWEQVTADVDPTEVSLRSAIAQLTGAVINVSHAATSAQKARAVEIIDEARRRLYALLGEATPADQDD